MRPPDQDVRERIVAARGVNLAVEAGAGTGKTTLLVERVADLVRTGTSLSRLAVITFTRKAAAELEARLVRRLAEARSAGESWAARALDDLPRADIGTTDSFCRGILGDFALEAGVPAGFALADEISQEALRDVAWARFLARSSEADARLFALLRELGVRAQTLREVADALVEQRDIPPAPAGIEDEGDLIEIFDAGLAPALALRDRCTDPSDRLLLRLDALARDAEIARSAGRVAGERVLLGWRRDRKTYASSQGRKDAWHGAKDDVVGALRALDGAVDAWRRAHGSARAAEVAAWLARFGAEYERLKRERGLVDFRDLALATRNLLRDHPSARRRVAARWDAILLDEAQDTDPLQMEIALLLAAAEDAGADAFSAGLAPGRLFLVGDPKQSIYRFRRADLELYARTRSAIVASGESPTISANFRSHPSILDFVNRLFRDWMQPEPGTTWQAPYVDLVAAAEGGDGVPADGANGRVALLLPDPEVRRAILRTRGASKPNADERTDLEIDAVVRLVRRALGRDGAGEPWRVLDASTLAERPARPGDIAVLVRRTAWGDRLLDALRRVGLPATSTGGRGFHAREEIRTLSLLLQAIVEPDDPTALFAALRSPALAVTDDDLVLRFLGPERGGRETDTVIDAEARLRALSEDARRLSPADFLERLAEEIALLPAFGFRPDGAARIENLRLVIEAAAPLADAGFDSLPEFVRWLAARDVADPLALGELDPPGGDVVTILTVHKAKGLEFPIVVLADLGGEAANPPRVVPDRTTGALEFRLGGDVETKGFREASAREAARRRAEDVRLLYVAATRARDRLVLSWPEGSDGFLHEDLLPKRLGATPGEAPSGETTLEILRAEALPPSGGTASVHVVDVAAAIATSRADAVSGELFATLDASEEMDRDGPRILPVTAYAELERAAHAATASRAECGGAGESEGRGGGEETRADADVAESAAPSGPEFGSYVHAALEVWDPALPFEEALSSAAESAFRRKADSAEAPERARWRAELARIARDPAVGEIFRALRSPAVRVFREVPFLLGLGDDALAGTLDVLVESADGTLAIADYKTERLGPGGAPAAAARHRRQASLYAYAAARLTGRPVTQVRLLFTAADPVAVTTLAVDDELLLGARAVLGNLELRRLARAEARPPDAQVPVPAR
ncbi:MAG: UvrD-helicase domain-containing protein [bacterium]